MRRRTSNSRIMQNTHNPDRPAQRPRSRRDVRRRAIAVTVLATVGLGALLAWKPDPPHGLPQTRLAYADIFRAKPRLPSATDATQNEVRLRFEQGVAMLQMRQYDYALTAFHQVLTLAPRLPEAHVNMGFALIGLEQWKQARDFFESAIELRRNQVNAYYGLAQTLEELGDRPGAMGAMQTYLHLAPMDDPFRPRAESALWEWRSEPQHDGADKQASRATPTGKP
ncbi:tetratricopeptide repeat protein [Aromatoleum toluclasticum]|uniref:tetratricopeptide repeat protein n=1 Tax=Aromatoleum toluclasticum TaxID=92003 RepID=UPI002FC2E591